MKCVNRLLNYYLEKNGKNALVNEGSRMITHNELEKESNKFANYIIREGIRKSERVVIMMDLHIDTITVVFGVIKTGAIYVPIDKTQSKENVEKILFEVTPTLIICNDIYLEKFEGAKCKKIIIKDGLSEYLKESDKLPNVNIISNDLLYIAFTSGTTGLPKGVMVSHRAVMTFVEAVTQNEKFHNKTTRTLCRTPISFDPFLTEVLPSVVSGGKIYIQERDATFGNFIKFIENNKITNFGCGPSQLYLMADNLEYISNYNLSSLKEIYVGYEKCPISVIRKLQEVYPNIVFINGYGTTETFASSTFYEIPKLNHDNDIPIGNTIENEQFLILNESKEECKCGEIGELVVRGSSLFNGYWNNTKETEKKLIINPLFPESNELVYMTGDLVVMDENRNIYFIGRKDEQVKINGYRVELGEIQYVIDCFDDIKECCVVYNDTQLICFYSLYSKRNNIDYFLREYCKKNLPLYKIPNKWIKVNEFPRNSNGKICKEKLLNIYKN